MMMMMMLSWVSVWRWIAGAGLYVDTARALYADDSQNIQ